METTDGFLCKDTSTSSPHSLGKLIEWKHHDSLGVNSDNTGPHSLGKLIEWKRRLLLMPGQPPHTSPLAGETN